MASRNSNEPPAIMLTTTTSQPQTTTSTTTYTINNRRPRDTTQNPVYLTRPMSAAEETEPFPALTPSQTPHTPNLHQSTSNDYFTQTPARYQVNPRSIGIKRLNSSDSITGRNRAGSGSLRRRAQTGPREMQQSDNATAGLAGLPGHYEIGTAPPSGGMGTIREDEEVRNTRSVPHRESVGEEGETTIGRSGSRRLRRASNAARSVLSKFSDDTEEYPNNRGRPGTTNNYEGDVVDYLDVLGETSFRPRRKPFTDLSRSRSFDIDYAH